MRVLYYEKGGKTFKMLEISPVTQTRHYENSEDSLSIHAGNAQRTIKNPLILSTADSRVRMYPLRENKEVCQGKEADSGSKCCESFEKSDPVGFWLKMSVERSISPSIPSKPVWSKKDTKSGRSSFLHLRLARLTKGRGSLS